MAGINALMFFIVGEFVMVALGFALPAWQHLLIACACINAACLLLYPLVPESARWLLSQGRTEEAMQSMQRIAKANKSQMPSVPLTSSRSKTQAANTPNDLEAAPDARGSNDNDLGGGFSGFSTFSRSDFSPSGFRNGPSGGALVTLDQPVTIKQLLQHPRLAVRMVVLLITSFTLMLNYYGISMGAGGIPGSL